MIEGVGTTNIDTIEAFIRKVRVKTQKNGANYYIRLHPANDGAYDEDVFHAEIELYDIGNEGDCQTHARKLDEKGRSLAEKEGALSAILVAKMDSEDAKQFDDDETEAETEIQGPLLKFVPGSGAAYPGGDFSMRQPEMMLGLQDPQAGILLAYRRHSERALDQANKMMGEMVGSLEKLNHAWTEYGKASTVQMSQMGEVIARLGEERVKYEQQAAEIRDASHRQQLEREKLEMRRETLRALGMTLKQHLPMLLQIVAQRNMSPEQASAAMSAVSAAMGGNRPPESSDASSRGNGAEEMARRIWAAFGKMANETETMEKIRAALGDEATVEVIEALAAAEEVLGDEK